MASRLANRRARSRNAIHRRWLPSRHTGVERLETRELLAIVTTGAASSVTTNSAVFSGTVNPQGTTTTNLFQYSTNSAFAPTLQSTFASGLNGPVDVDLDSSGNVLVLEEGTFQQQFGAVKRYTSAGSLFATNGGLMGPNSITVGSAGVILAFGNTQGVARLNANGTLTELAAGNSALYIAADQTGLVYYSQPFVSNIMRINTDGTVQPIYHGFQLTPTALAISSNNNIYMHEASDGSVQRIDRVTFETTFITMAPAGGIVDMDVDRFGNMYFTTLDGQVREITASGQDQLIASGITDIGGLAVDALGSVYVVDGGNSRVLKYSIPSLAATPGSASGTSPTNIQASVTGLSQATPYFFRAVAATSAVQAELGATQTFATVPVSAVSSVQSTTNNGTYGVGSTINITISFTNNVTVTGIPQLQLNSGGVANYFSGSGTNTLTFRYIVGVGQNTSKLDYTSTSALTLPGGATIGVGTTPSVRTLPAPGSAGSIAGTRTIGIDTTAPTVTSFTPSIQTSMNFAPFTYTIKFSEIVTGATTASFDNSQAAPIQIDSVTGNGTDTLTVTEAVNYANTLGAGTHEIIFDDIVFAGRQTINLISQLNFNNPTGKIIVHAPGGGLILNQTGTSRLVAVSTGSEVELYGLTFTGGNTTIGGAISNTGTLRVFDSTFTGNRATLASNGGGAINNQGTMLLQNNTFTGNTADVGGVIRNNATRSLTMIGNTLVGNSSTTVAGAIYNVGNLTLTGNLIAGNSSGGGAEIFNAGSGTITSSGNLLGDSSKTSAQAFTNYTPTATDRVETSDTGNVALSAIVSSTLTDSGGPTKTLALVANSPAIGAAVAVAGLTLDQRGYPRHPTPDAGAYEHQVETLVVTTLTDEDNGSTDPTLGTGTSLREAVYYANLLGAGTHAILFDSALFATQRTLAISSALGAIILTNGAGLIQITAPSAGLRLDGQNTTKIFDLSPHASATFEGITFVNAFDSAVRVNSTGTLTVNNSTFYKNVGNLGGGISSDGSVTVNNSLFVENSASTTGNDFGGGIYSRGILFVTNSTFYKNYASNSGGALFAFGSQSTITNSTIVDNTAEVAGGIRGRALLVLKNNLIAGNHGPALGNEIAYVGAGAFELTETYNVIGDSSQTIAQAVFGFTPHATDVVLTSDAGNLPLFAIVNVPPAENGGPTQTLSLVADGPAIDAGDPAFVAPPATDQRGVGFDRVVNGRVDIGAFEVQAVIPSVQFQLASSIVNQNAGTFSVTVMLSEAPTSALDIAFTVSGDAVAGVNYANLSTSPLHFAIGQTTATITGTVIDLGYLAPQRTLKITLGTPSSGATLGLTAVHTITIKDTNSKPTVEFVVTNETLKPGDAINATIVVSAPVAVPLEIPVTYGGDTINGSNTNILSPSIWDLRAGQLTYKISGTVLGNTLNGGTLTITLNTPALLSLGTNTVYTMSIVNPPVITSATATNITSTSALIGGNIIGDGGADIIKRGVLYAPSLSGVPLTLGSLGVTQVDDPAAVPGTFVTLITGLNPRSSYKYVAFATNSLGTRYSSPVNVFTTPEVPSLVVSTNLDVANSTDGQTSLREAIAYANSLNGAQTVSFASALAEQSIVLASALDLSSSTAQLTIDGGGVITISGNTSDRVFSVASLSTVTLVGLTITGGNASGNGGAIFNAGTLFVTDSILSNNTSSSGNGGGAIFNAGTLTVMNTTFLQNQANSAIGGGGLYNEGTATILGSTFDTNSTTAFGGGIYNDGTLTLRNSTFAGNHADLSGGAIDNFTGSLTVENSTLSGNSAGTAGGGIASDNAFTLRNSIVAGNTAGASGINEIHATATSAVASSGFNLIGHQGETGAQALSGFTLAASDINATSSGLSVLLANILSPLANNGGLTETFALPLVSPAINRGNPSYLSSTLEPLTTDQRGASRIAVGNLDIGAFEHQGKLSAVINITGGNSTYNALPQAASATATGLGYHTANLSGLVRLLYTTDGVTFTATAPVNAGTYSVYYTFDGNADYSAVTSPTDSGATIQIGKVNAVITVTGTTASADNLPHPATGSALGVESPTPLNLTPLLHLSYKNLQTNVVSTSAPVTVGTYQVLASFDGNGNYNAVATYDTGKQVVITAVAALNVTISGAPATGHSPEGKSITLCATATDPSTPGNTRGITYVWQVTKDGATYATSSSATLCFTPNDNGTYVVTVTATKSGKTGSSTKTIVVDNVAPTPTISGVPSSGHSAEGKTLNLRGTVKDPSTADVAAGFTYAWRVTKDGSELATGSAATFSFTPSDNGTYVFSLTATDKDGSSNTTNKTITVDNVAPTVGITGPSDGVRGQARTFTLTAKDASAADQAAGFTYTINWGDGSTQTITGPSGTTASHVYTATGNYQVKVTAKDKDTGTSNTIAKASTISAAALQADPLNPGKTALFVGGTTGADVITLKPSDNRGTVNVKIGSTVIGNFKPTGSIVVYGQAGNDSISLQSATINCDVVRLSTPAYLYGDDGNDSLSASGSSANNVLFGGVGNDTLQGGRGRDLLIGGLGLDVLHGEDGADILIGGISDHDTNLAAVNALMSEWGKTNVDYSTRIKRLSGVLAGGANGSYLLNATTVHDDAAQDTLFGKGDVDYFFAKLSGTTKDQVKDSITGELITAV